MATDEDRFNELDPRSDRLREVIEVAAVDLADLWLEAEEEALDELEEYGSVRDPKAGYTNLSETRSEARDMGSRVGAAEAGYTASRVGEELIVEAWGPDRSRCLEQAILGWVSAFANVSVVQPAYVLPICIDDAGNMDTLVALLDEMVGALEVFRVVPVHVFLEDTEDGRLAGTVDVAPFSEVSRVGATPRRVLHEECEIGEFGERWRVRAAFDAAA